MLGLGDKLRSGLIKLGSSKQQLFYSTKHVSLQRRPGIFGDQWRYNGKVGIRYRYQLCLRLPKMHRVPHRYILMLSLW